MRGQYVAQDVNAADSRHKHSTRPVTQGSDHQRMGAGVLSSWMVLVAAV